MLHRGITTHICTGEENGQEEDEMVYGRFAKTREDLETANAICREVFKEELGLAGDDGDEEEFVLSALAFAGEEPAGTGQLLFDETFCAIRDVAVLPQYRGAEYGDFIVRLLIDKALTAGAQEIHLDALAGTEAFFEKIGFEPEGTLFEKSGGQWQPMILKEARPHNCCECGAN